MSPLLPGEVARPDDSPPVAADDAYAMTGRQQLGANVSANDTDADGDAISVAMVSGPSHGTLGFGTDGRFTYTPDRGFDGVDTFSYVASDAQVDSNVATVNIAVTRVDPINDPPNADADEYRIDEGETLSVAGPGVLANDSDVNGDGLSAVLKSAPTSGLLLLGTDGSFDYTPNTGFHGTDSFTYVANDGQADSNPATVTITVDAVNHAPAAAEDSYSTPEDQPLSVSAGGVLGNDADADGDALTAVLAQGPDNGTLTLNPDGFFQYTPNAGFHGTDSFTYAANDGQADSNPATVTITVEAAEEPPAPELAVHLEVSSSSFGPETGPTWGGSTFWVSAYVKDLRAVPQGVVGGALDLEFDATRLTPTGKVAYGPQFTEYHQGTADSQAGVIDEAGALASEGGVGVDSAAPFVAWEFRRGGPGAPEDPNSQVVFAADPGEGTATIVPANFAVVGAGTPVDWSNVTFDEAQLSLRLGDFNGDGAVNHYDLALWIPHADSSPKSGNFDPKFDLSGDSRVDAVDLAILTRRLFRPVSDDLQPPAQGDSGQPGAGTPDNGPPAHAQTPRDLFGHHHKWWRDDMSSAARIRRIGSIPCHSAGDDLNWVSSIGRRHEHDGHAWRQIVAIDWAFQGDDFWMGG
jgi:VCBS repeat-containing protein